MDRFNEDPSLRFQLDIPDMDVERGYRLWADTYDDFHNPLIAVEGPIIRRLILFHPAAHLTLRAGQVAMHAI